MDCKAFTSRHAAYIDDTLPGVEMSSVRDHLTTCAKCARRDAEVRRALMLVKNLPPITVSDGFQDRLRARLAVEHATPAGHAPQPRAQAGMMKWALAAGLLIIVAGGITSLPSRADTPTRLPAVVATVPMAVGDDPASAYVASMSTGIPMWPALMLAEEGPLRFAATGFQAASWDGVRPN